MSHDNKFLLLEGRFSAFNLKTFISEFDISIGCALMLLLLELFPNQKSHVIFSFLVLGWRVMNGNKFR